MSRAQDYPPILAAAGLTDPRVTYWEPAKWVARLRDRKTRRQSGAVQDQHGCRPCRRLRPLLRLEEIAYSYAFALKVVGLAGSEEVSGKAAE